MMLSVNSRGINRQRIFEDDEDYSKFLQTMKEVKKKSGYELYAYCLMSNHVHLLMKEGQETLETAFKRIGVRYVYWYNWKYQRRGHLFQDRYKSEAVDTTSYFLTVLRYIHMNPVKAKMVSTPEEYQWSSYREYMNVPRISDVRKGLELFHHQHSKARVLLKEFHREENNDRCMEHDRGVRWQDHEAVDYLKVNFGLENPKDLHQIDVEKRNEILKICKEEGMSIRQLERLTGVSFSVIRYV